MNTMYLDVKGMTCGGCVKNVTAALTRVPGVSTVDVNLLAGHAVVSGNFPQGGDPLVLALTAAGYPAKLTFAIPASILVKKSGGCCE